MSTAIVASRYKNRLGIKNFFKSFVDISKLGGIITKSITFEPRLGNSNPRILESESGMLNAIGLANIGVYEFCDKISHLLIQYDISRFLFDISVMVLHDRQTIGSAVSAHNVN